MLCEKAINVSDVVVASFRDASALQTIQTETSRSAVELIQTLENLTNTTYTELGKINISTFAIQRQLLLQQDSVVTWRHFALQIFSIFGYGGPLFHS